MPKQIHPRGAEWERGRQAGYYAGQKSNLEYLRECRKGNKRLREALQEAAEYYEMLEQATGIEHGVLKTIRAALAGSGES